MQQMLDRLRDYATRKEFIVNVGNLEVVN